MPYDDKKGMMEKRRQALKPAGAVEVELAFNKASRGEGEASGAPDIEGAVEFLKTAPIDEETRGTLMALLGAEEDMDEGVEDDLVEESSDEVPLEEIV